MTSIPPPPACPPTTTIPAPAPAAKPPIVSPTGPPGAFLVELLIYNGAPFKDHWAYFVRSHADPGIGTRIHAMGDVRSGFEFQINRQHDLRDPGNSPTNRVPLQWVDAKYFDYEEGVLDDRESRDNNVPLCGFEASAYKAKVPEKSLNSIDDEVSSVRLLTICFG